MNSEQPSQPVVLKSDSSGGSPIKVPALNFKVFLSAFLIVLIVAGIAVGVYLARNRTQLSSKAAEGIVTLQLTPSQIKATVDEQFSATIEIDSKDLSITGAELQITYDAQILALEEFEKGDYLPTSVGQAEISSGSATLIILANPPNLNQGKGKLATLKFRALQPISIPSEIRIDSSKTQISAQGYEGNVLGSTQIASVLVSEIVSTEDVSEPSPSASESPEPSEEASPSASISPSPSSSSQNKDFNADGKVNSIDLSVLYSAWGTPQTEIQKKADINTDGNVNGIDYSIFLQGFNP